MVRIIKVMGIVMVTVIVMIIARARSHVPNPCILHLVSWLGVFLYGRCVCPQADRDDRNGRLVFSVTMCL